MLTVIFRCYMTLTSQYNYNNVLHNTMMSTCFVLSASLKVGVCTCKLVNASTCDILLYILINRTEGYDVFVDYSICIRKVNGIFRYVSKYKGAINQNVTLYFCVVISSVSFLYKRPHF